jgi:hypothetical protein
MFQPVGHYVGIEQTEADFYLSLQMSFILRWIQFCDYCLDRDQSPSVEHNKTGSNYMQSCCRGDGPAHSIAERGSNIKQQQFQFQGFKIYFPCAALVLYKQDCSVSAWDKVIY